MKLPIEIKKIFSGMKTVSELVSKIKETNNYIKMSDIKTTHIFTGGLYCRTFFPKKNTLIIGKIHKFSGVSILLKGAVTIYDGEKTRTFKAPFTWESKENSQKVGFFHEDSEFSSVVTCFSDNVEDAENELYYDDNTSIEQVKAWYHYALMKHTLGLSEENVQEYVNLDNMVKKSNLTDFKLKNSNIHGIGFFTTKDYKKGDILGYSLINGERTELGRWVNDSNEPNVYQKRKSNDSLKIIALTDIASGQEITISYLNNLGKRIIK